MSPSCIFDVVLNMPDSEQLFKLKKETRQKHITKFEDISTTKLYFKIGIPQMDRKQ